MNGQALPAGLNEQEREDMLASEFITIQMDLYNR
jgi:hypothetical protein